MILRAANLGFDLRRRSQRWGAAISGMQAQRAVTLVADAAAAAATTANANRLLIVPRVCSAPIDWANWAAN